jgi:hypothetical protein
MDIDGPDFGMVEDPNAVRLTNCAGCTSTSVPPHRDCNLHDPLPPLTQPPLFYPDIKGTIQVWVEAMLLVLRKVTSPRRRLAMGVCASRPCVRG